MINGIIREDYSVLVQLALSMGSFTENKPFDRVFLRLIPMAHNEDLPHSAIDGQTPEGGGRREGLSFVPSMAELNPQRRNPRRDTRERQGSSPCHSQSPNRQRRRMDPQVLEDRVRE